MLQAMRPCQVCHVRQEPIASGHLFIVEGVHGPVAICRDHEEMSDDEIRRALYP
jgi:hypothetical protein